MYLKKMKSLKIYFEEEELETASFHRQNVNTKTWHESGFCNKKLFPPTGAVSQEACWLW